MAGPLLFSGCSGGGGSVREAAPSDETETRVARAPTSTPSVPTASPSLIDAHHDAAAKAFQGADCYGPRLDECLDVNPAADALAQDPATCEGLDIRMCLVPVGHVRADVLEAIIEFHKRTANIDVVILPSVPIPADAVNRETSQITAKRAFELIDEVYPIEGLDRSTYVAISSIDMTTDDLGWLFGVRYSKGYFGNNHGSFSYFRMVNVRPYSGGPVTDELLHLRVAKYAARYTAILHLNYEPGNDIRYLNYRDMYGFSDLDSMGTSWPKDPPTCGGWREVTCVIPDGASEDLRFNEDVRLAAERIRREHGLAVEYRAPTTFVYSSRNEHPDWLYEFAGYMRGFSDAAHNPGLNVVGITHAPARSDGVAGPLDRAYPEISLATLSAYGGGKPGTAEHRERVYLLVLRGVLVAHFGLALDDDPNSLLYRGITSPEQLDGKAIPAIPK
jgi:hypothetical protein